MEQIPILKKKTILKIMNQKTNLINQSHNVIKDTITLTWSFNVLLCSLFNWNLVTWNSEY